LQCSQCEECLCGARFELNLPLEDAIRSHACSLHARMCATNGIPLECPLPCRLTLQILSNHWKAQPFCNSPRYPNHKLCRRTDDATQHHDVTQH
jgi:hypothetical protein